MSVKDLKQSNKRENWNKSAVFVKSKNLLNVLDVKKKSAREKRRKRDLEFKKRRDEESKKRIVVESRASVSSGKKMSVGNVSYLKRKRAED